MSSKAAKKLSLEEVENQFKEAGFINIESEPIYDLITGWFKKDGSIESIKIDEKTSFSEGDTFRPDVNITISYHTFSKNKEKN